MSGFIGLVSKAITEENEILMNRCQAEITSVCNDDSGQWKSEHVDLRFGLFRVNDDTNDEHLPYTSDQNLYIIGDVRLDNRDCLISKLNKNFPELNNSYPDSYIVLHSYMLWGSECVNHIAGDYSFAIWNEKESTLFCARDHFGVIPFYYAQTEHGFIFTNFYHALKEVNGLITDINEEILKNYFFLGVGQSHYSTIYKNIHKLPPAHTLIYENGNFIITKYWSPTLPKKLIRYKTTEEYITRFTEIFERSVKDRLRNKNIATHLSGGMDSSSVTAMANRILSNKDDRLTAYNVQSTYLVTEREGYFASLIANHLDLELKYLVADDFSKNLSVSLDEWLPEPVGIPNASPAAELNKDAEKYSLKVLLTGFGSDVLFRYNTETWFTTLKKMQFYVLYSDIVNFLKTHGQFPRLGIKSKLLKRGLNTRGIIPSWVKNTYISEDYIQSKIGAPGLNSGMFSNGLWQSIFEHSHQGFSKYKVKIRHPFFSLELIEFLLAVPPHLLFNKYLLRQSMVPHLPAAIVHRPKTLLYGDFMTNNLILSGVLKELRLKIKEEENFLKDKIDIHTLISLIEQPEKIKHADQRIINFLIHILAWKKHIKLEDKTIK